MELILVVGIILLFCWVCSIISQKNKENDSSNDNTYTREPTVVRPVDLEELKQQKIGTKDSMTLKILVPGDEVYLCRICLKAHLNESWEYMNKKCHRGDCIGERGVVHCKLPGEYSWEDF